MASEYRQVQIPAELCAEAEEKFGGSFESADKLLEFVLQELLRGDTVDMDRSDQAAVEDRLRDLGYI